MASKLAKLGAGLALLTTGAIIAHATGIEEESYNFSQNTSSQEQTIDQNYWTADGILTTPAIIELSRNRDYDINELISGGNVTSITSPEPINFLNGKLNFLTNSERAKEFYTEEARQRMIRTYQGLITRVESINSNDTQARGLSRESLERALQDGFLTTTELETILSGVYVIDKKGHDSTVGNYDAPMLVWIPETSTNRIGPEREGIRQDPLTLIDDGSCDDAAEDYREKELNASEHEIQSQEDSDALRNQEMRRAAQSPDNPLNRREAEITESLRRAERQASSESREQNPNARDSHRLALVIDGFGGNRTAYGGLGVSVNPSSSIPLGFTASALAGMQGDTLDEITTEPSPYGIYGHGITEQQGRRLLGGALEFSFGGPSFYVSVGTELTYSSWIEKVTEEICKNGEVLVSNQTFTPNSEISGRIRLGLEAVTKSGLGLGGIININPETGEVTLGGRISYGK